MVELGLTDGDRADVRALEKRVSELEALVKEFGALNGWLTKQLRRDIEQLLERGKINE